MSESTRTYGRPAMPVVDAGRVSRLAIVADVHGNAVALAAVVEEIRRDPPDLTVVNGDLSWGPEPEAAFEVAGGLPDAVFVRGNAESALLRYVRDPDLDRSETAAWMLERHDPARIAQIEAFAGTVTVDVDGIGRVFVCHGSPRGDQEIVTPRTPKPRMSDLLAGTELDVLVTAHVHLQFDRKVLGIRSLNAGSVGLQYGGTPAAYWAEIGPAIRLRTTPYDLEEAERRIRSSGIPNADQLVSLLRDPPSAEEVIEDGERLEVSD
jgi:predicted phosphodiesterase